MVNILLNRMPSNELKNQGRKVKLPCPCLTLMGVEIALQFDVTDAAGEPVIPNDRYAKRFDPKKFLLYWPYDAVGLVDTEVVLPRQVTHLTAAGLDAEDMTDQLSTAARDLLGAIEEYEQKFTKLQTLHDGTEVRIESKAFTPRAEAFKASLRAGVQKAFLNYQFKQLLELRRLLKKQVFQVGHPGCNAPLICDPTLAVDEVRVPSEIFATFSGCDALVLRHPVLDTVYRLKVVEGSDRVIALNSLLLHKLNADVDGDSLFVTPIPKDLDGGQLSNMADSIVYDEADVLMPLLEGQQRQLPVNVPPLNLHDFGPESENSKFVAAHGIRNFKNAVWGPMDQETYFSESLAAAARFRWEKDSIGKADSVRRSLLVMTTDPEEIRSINRFCGSVSQKAIDAGKHREEFPLDNYMQAFDCKYVGTLRDGSTRIFKFKDRLEMAQTMVMLTGLPELTEDALRIATMLFDWPEFPKLGVRKLIERYFPWWAFASIKQTVTPRDEKMMREARILTRLDSAMAGECNLYF